MENKIEISKSTAADIDRLMEIRLEMLRVVNGLEGDYEFSDELKTESRKYFLSGDQTTLLATDGEKTIGCASINYITIMPTFSHPTGKRAFLMSVYTQKEYRRQGIAKRMVEQLISEARDERRQTSLQIARFQGKRRDNVPSDLNILATDGRCGEDAGSIVICQS